MPSASATSQCGLRVRLEPSEAHVRRAGSPHAAHDDAGLLAADGHARVGRVGDAQQQVVELAPGPRRASASRSSMRRPSAVERARRPPTSGPVGVGPALDGRADPLAELALRSARSPSASPVQPRGGGHRGATARRRASGSSPLSMAPWRGRVRRRRAGAAGRRSCAGLRRRSRRRRGRPPAATARSARHRTKPGSRLASSQPARGPLARPRNAA